MRTLVRPAGTGVRRLDTADAGRLRRVLRNAVMNGAGVRAAVVLDAGVRAAVVSATGVRAAMMHGTASGVHNAVTDTGVRNTGAGASRADDCTGARGDGAVREARAQVRLREQRARLCVQLGQRRHRALDRDLIVHPGSTASTHSSAPSCRVTHVQVGAASAGPATARKRREKAVKRIVKVVKMKDERE
jgi:hypothetical protein